MISFHLNHCQYGDGCVCAPFKDSSKHDVLRVKGGTMSTVSRMRLINRLFADSRVAAAHRGALSSWCPVALRWSTAARHSLQEV